MTISRPRPGTPSDAAPPANVTVPQAKAQCGSLAGCAGFTFEAGAATPTGIVQVYFKSKATSWNTNSEWWSYSKPVEKARVFLSRVLERIAASPTPR